MVLWLIAWLFAGITRHAARREAVENATLKAMQEQNELLKRELNAAKPSRDFPGNLAPNRACYAKAGRLVTSLDCIGGFATMLRGSQLCWLMMRYRGACPDRCRSLVVERGK